MDEREFFDERPEKKLATLNCPHCQQSGEYEVTWIVRTKKRQISGRADERDRARFAKARSYMLRKDDLMMCKNMRCRKRFDIREKRATPCIPAPSAARKGVSATRWVGRISDGSLLPTPSFILTSFPSLAEAARVNKGVIV